MEKDEIDEKFRALLRRSIIISEDQKSLDLFASYKGGKIVWYLQRENSNLLAIKTEELVSIDEMEKTHQILTNSLITFYLEYDCRPQDLRDILRYLCTEWANNRFVGYLASHFVNQDTMANLEAKVNIVFEEYEKNKKGMKWAEYAIKHCPEEQIKSSIIAAALAIIENHSAQEVAEYLMQTLLVFLPAFKLKNNKIIWWGVRTLQLFLEILEKKCQSSKIYHSHINKIYKSCGDAILVFGFLYMFSIKRPEIVIISEPTKKTFKRIMGDTETILNTFKV